MPISPSARLGSYEVLSPLGAGGMGEVWRVRHLMLDRQAAAKLIRPESLGPEAGEKAVLPQSSVVKSSLSPTNKATYSISATLQNC